jgi:hypothetical protein
VSALRLSLQAQIERMRAAIEAMGESIVTCDELLVLCEDEVLASNQWNAIARIAIEEEWSFTYFPDGSVRFAKLDSN